jgi:hypothetical protein
MQVLEYGCVHSKMLAVDQIRDFFIQQVEVSFVGQRDLGAKDF